jgi:Flp pilus assembly protein TadG
LLRSKGSAPVDFILIAVPMLLVELGIIAIAINGYAKNIAQDIAVEAAQFAALADQSAETARAKAAQELRDNLGQVFQATVSVARVNLASGECLVESSVNLQPVGLGIFGSLGRLQLSGVSVCEVQ